MGMNSLAFVVIDATSVAMAAILYAAGIVLVVLGWLDVLPRFEGQVNIRPSASAQSVLVQVAGGFAGLILGYMFTGWPVFALFSALGGASFPTLMGSKKARKAEIDKVDALATWIESVRDNISGSAGLQQALRESGRNAPIQIRGEVRDMTLRLQHETVQSALNKLATDLANPASDLVVACLVLATTRSAGSLGSVLAQTAQAARDSASMMRQIEAGRASSLSQAKLTGYVALFVMAYMVLFKQDFVAPYNSSGGQMILFIILSMGAGTVFMLYRMSQPNQQERVFKPDESALDPASIVASAEAPTPEGVA